MSTPAKTAKYRRILVKLSGEILGGRAGVGLSPDAIDRITNELIAITDSGVELAVVVGGGNFFRGGRSTGLPISRTKGDQIGMLCTLLNAMALEQVFHSKGANAVVQSAVPVPSFVQTYDGISSIGYLEQKSIVLFAGGTGNALLTTDTAASLRAVDISADILLKATKVDGVYSEMPDENTKSVPYEHVSFDKVLADQLEVMDLSAIAICREHAMKIRVFNGYTAGAITRAGLGDDIGTLVSSEATH